MKPRIELIKDKKRTLPIKWVTLHGRRCQCKSCLETGGKVYQSVVPDVTEQNDTN